MHRSQKKWNLIKSSFCIFCVFVFVSCANDSSSPSLFSSENDTPITDGGEIDPSVGGSTYTCELDADGSCLDTAENTDLVNIAATGLNFGLNELDAVECIGITIPGGVSYAAEIDKDNTSDVDGVYQFAVLDAAGNYSQDRVDGSGTVSLCYLRNAVGTHTGQIKVVLNAETSASAYAYVIPVSGETMAKVFTITSPIENQIIDARAGHHNGDGVTSEGDYLITASGSVNLDLTSIFANGTNTDLIIAADTVKYKTAFDSSSGAFTKEIGLPSQEGIYDVTFSLDTNKDEPIEKVVPVVVAGPPQMEIVVKDSGGNDINQATPTDALELVVGFKITNLPTAGSSATEMPVIISDMQWDGEALTADKEIYYQEGQSWCINEDGDDYANFDGEITYCTLPLKEYITDLQTGTNTITAKATNALGETTAQFILIVDNAKPTITITSPADESIVAPGTQTITVTGTVQNYAPVDVEDSDGIPTNENAIEGSFCDPSSADCPNSNVKLWANLSTASETLPIQIYPKTTFDEGLTLREINDQIEGDPDAENNLNSGQCYTTTSSQTIFSGDAVNTTTDASGNLITTENDDDGATTTTYTTASDGTVTVTQTDGTTATYASSDDPETDVTVNVTTNSTTGEITQTTTQRICNIPEGTFSFTLTIPTNLYTNILEFQASSVSGHNTIKVVTFQQGELKTDSRPHLNNSITSALTTSWLGTIAEECDDGDVSCVARAPVMLHIGQGLIDKDTDEGAKIIKVVEKFLNENVKFEDVANGWMYAPTDELDNTDLEADFRSQVPYNDFQNDLTDEQKEKFIQQGLHSGNMALKYWALLRYIEYRQDTETNSTCNNNPELCFFERDGNPDQYNVALDSDNNAITTAFVPISDLKYVFGNWPNLNLYDMPNVLREWPLVAEDNIDFNDFVSGKWLIDSLSISDHGFISADLCVVPDDTDNPELTDEYAVYGCDANVSGATTPAFWGHIIAYNLVEGGLLGDLAPAQTEDPVMPLLWSVGKIRLKLENIIRLTREKVNGSWTNKIEINKEDIKIINPGELDDLRNEDIMGAKAIQIEPFENCPSYYASLFPAFAIPYGCSNKSKENYPVALEWNSEQGILVYNTMMANTLGGSNPYLLEVMWEGILWTFKKLISTIDDEMINPLISDAYDYPVWAMDTSRLQTSFEFSGFTGETTVKNLDLQLSDDGVSLRVPLKLGAEGVLSRTLSQNLTGATSKLGSGYLVRSTSEEGTKNADNKKLTDYPLTAGPDEPFLSASINLEEIANAALHILFKKGPLSLLKELDIDELDPKNNWQVGIDKVILNRFDICDIGGMLASDLPKEILFATVGSLFNEPTLHLDVILDPDNAPTLSLNNIDGSSNATEIQLGLTNVQIAVKELIAAGENVYKDPSTQPEILRVRLDGVIRIQLAYFETGDQILIKAFIPGLSEQNLHLSVPAGHGGATYNDSNVVVELYSLLTTALGYVSKTFVNAADAEASVDIVLDGGSELSVKNLLDATVTVHTTSGPNKACDGNVAKYENDTYNGDTNTHSHSFYPSSTSPQHADLSEAIQQDTCKWLNTIQDDPIAEILCDFGIDDITVEPSITFDNANGYIHVSGVVGIELKDE